MKKQRKQQKQIVTNPIPPEKSAAKPLFSPVQLKVLSIVGLILVGVFSFFIRYEDYPKWKKIPDISTYKGEYQMGEFDSYLYLQLAKDISQNKYAPLDTMRFYPQGAKNPVIPPLSSLIAAKLHQITGVPIASIALFIPVFLSLLLIPIVFFTSRHYGFSNFSTIVASFFAMFSLTFVVRSRLGIFDTDSLNVVFIMLIPLCFMLWGEIKSKRNWVFLVLGWVFTLLFYIWWNTAGSVVIFSSFIAFTFSLFINFKSTQLKVKIGIIAAMLIPLLIAFGDQLLYFVGLVLKNETRTFKIVDEISELNPVTLKEFYEKTAGNLLLFLVMLLGIVWFIIKHKAKVLYFAVPIVFAFMAFVAGNRFLLFSAPILGLGMGAALQFGLERKQSFFKPLVLVVGCLLIIFSLNKNYDTIVKGYAKPAAFDNIHLLNAVNSFTPEGSLVLSNWDIGYQIRYYLERFTFTDGELADRADILYYSTLPLATNDFAFSANFINFYISKSGVMEQIYSIYPDKNEAFIFLRNILKNKPSEAYKVLSDLNTQNQLRFSENLANVDAWMTFLYPPSKRDVYILLHQRMLQTMSWFKQGNIDLNLMETKGMPLYLQLENLKQNGNIIANNQIKIDVSTGISMFQNQSRQDFARILSIGNNGILDSKEFKMASGGSTIDNRFHFHYNLNNGYGVALSKEVGESVFHRLYMIGEQTAYFEPIKLQQPLYQIWKVKADTWEK